MALQKQLEEMSLAKDAIRIVREFACDKYAPTPTACIIKEAVAVKLNHWYGSPTLWQACFRGEPLFPNRGFEKYLSHHFDPTPGSVWMYRFTHRKLGHTLFLNQMHSLRIYGCAADRQGNSIKSPGLEKMQIL